MIESTRKMDNQSKNDSPIPTTVDTPTNNLRNLKNPIERTPEIRTDSTIADRRGDVRKNVAKSLKHKQTSGLKESYEERFPTRIHRYDLRKNVKRVNYYDEASIGESTEMDIDESTT